MKKKTTSKLNWERIIKEVTPILLQTKGNKPRKGKVIRCPRCDRPFYVNPFMVKKIHSGYVKYCGKECETYSKLTNRPIECIVCKKEFYCSKSQQRLRNRKTCSLKCSGKRTSERQRGENNPTWNGGKSGERSIRYCKKSKDWRRGVFKRDNYTCQECNVKGGYLEAHHIKPFAYFPKLRFTKLNGQTLCRKCHDKTKISAKKMKEIYG